MKRFVKVLIKTAIAATLVFSMTITAFADQKEEAQRRIEQLRAEQSQLQAQLNSMKAEAANTEAFIADLDAQIRDIIGRITEKQQQIQQKQAEIEQKQAEIEQTQRELEEAIATEQRQYEALKARIKEMYEQDSVSAAQRYMELMMNSDSLGEFLNGNKYSSEISRYDSNLLAEYKATRIRIAELKEKLQRDKSVLEVAKQTLEAEEAQLQDQMQQLEVVLLQKEEELVSINAVIVEKNLSLAEKQQAEYEYTQFIAAINAAEEAARRNSGSSYTPSAGSLASNIVLRYPTIGGYISSQYGGRVQPTAGASSDHKGIDIAAQAGTPIYSSAAGTVVASGYSSVRGNYIVINHGNGVSTLYQHNSVNNVSVGQTVSAGQQIGTVGNTGVSTGAHLHYEVINNGTNVNPLAYVSP